MVSVLPPLEEDLLLKLFHKAARVHWTSEDFDWQASMALSPERRRALARVLTPVYLGEQTAMLGGAAALLEVAKARETSAQVFLAGFVMDEARHFETLTRLYRRLGHDPVGLREMPDMLRYHHRLRQGDKLDWAWGILISDVFARHFYHAFVDRYGDRLIGLMSQRFIVDEGRHQAFAEEYIRRALPGLGAERRRSLVAMWDDLLRLMERMYERLRPDTDALEIDGARLLEDFRADLAGRLARLGLDGPMGPAGPIDPPRRQGPGRPGAPPEPSGEAGQPLGAGASSAPNNRPVERHADRPAGRHADRWGSCASCLLAWFCATRMAQAGLAAAG